MATPKGFESGIIRLEFSLRSMLCGSRRGFCLLVHKILSTMNGLPLDNDTLDGVSRETFSSQALVFPPLVNPLSGLRELAAAIFSRLEASSADACLLTGLKLFQKLKRHTLQNSGY